MNIVFYAGSLRPGGGLTVAKIMIEALAENTENNICVYTGAKDSSAALKTTFEQFQNVTEITFLHQSNSFIRYILSKFYFLIKSLFNNKGTLLISINYYIPSFYKLFVYHLNLLSFLRQEGDRLPKIIKELDAKIACKYADINVFESRYLKDTAEKYTGVNIQNPNVLYIGVDPDFYFHSKNTNDKELNTNILLVSSMQPHKDNETCIKALAKLIKSNPEVPWLLNIAGGQTKEQWQPLIEFSNTLGVCDAIRVLGPLDKTELSKLMNNSLCLISTSKVESFCMVALEAMAAGCPVIVTNETSMPESVGDAAKIVTAGNTDNFSLAILDYYENPEKRDKYIKMGIQRSQKFTLNTFKKKLIEIINRTH